MTNNTKHEDALLKMGIGYFREHILKTLGIEYEYIDTGNWVWVYRHWFYGTCRTDDTFPVYGFYISDDTGYVYSCGIPDNERFRRGRSAAFSCIWSDVFT